MQYCNEKKKKRSEFYPCAVNILVFLPFFWVKGDYSFSPFIINKESPSGMGMIHILTVLPNNSRNAYKKGFQV